jgi:hypothetical protein
MRVILYEKDAHIVFTEALYHIKEALINRVKRYFRGRLALLSGM